MRDATLTLDALMIGGYSDEARAWRDWVARTVAGDPARLQIRYGLAGERRLTEFELDWLPGYEESRPVRVGNGAWNQFQLDVYGETASCLYRARRMGLPEVHEALHVGGELLDRVEQIWQRPDEGIWEVRGGGKRHFTHSKVMAWVADRSRDPDRGGVRRGRRFSHLALIYTANAIDTHRARRRTAPSQSAHP